MLLGLFVAAANGGYSLAVAGGLLLAVVECRLQGMWGSVVVAHRL